MMATRTQYLQIRVTPEFLHKIDGWRAEQKLPVTRTAAVVHLIERGFDADARDDADA